MNQKTDHAQLIINPFVIFILLAAGAVILQQTLPLFRIPVLPSRILGVILVAINFVLGLPAFSGMLRVRTSPNPHRPTTALVVSGIYRYTRNPMYTGMTLIFAGVLTYFQITWGLLLVPLVVWLITIWVIIPEEKYLQSKFGDEYLQYKLSVRRWI